MALPDNKGALIAEKRILTPVARATFVHLLEPQAFQGQTPKYSCGLIFDKNADLSVLRTAAEELAKGQYGQYYKNYAYKSFTKGSEIVEKRKEKNKSWEEFVDTIYMNPKTTDVPDVVTKIGGKYIRLDNPNDVYWGMYVRAVVSVFLYNTGGNKGVGFALNRVIKIREGEKLGNYHSVESDFDILGDSDVSLSPKNPIPDYETQSDMWDAESGKAGEDTGYLDTDDNDDDDIPF